MGALNRATAAVWRLFTPRASAESQAPPPSDDFWYTPLSSKGNYTAGDMALRMSVVYRCTKILCDTVGSVPLIVYRRTSNGGRERATDHPLYTLLHDRPNAWQSPMEFGQLTQAHVVLRGSAYAEIISNGAGIVEQLRPVHPDHVRVEQASDLSLIFIVNEPGKPERVLTSGEMLRFTGLSTDPLKPLSLLSLARESFELTASAEMFGVRQFRNQARPSGVLRHPGVLDTEARTYLRESWKRLYAGIENTGQTVVLEEGMDWKPIQLSAVDAEFIATRKFQIAEICRWFGIPPHLVHDLDRSTFSNIEHQSIDFVMHSVRPWLVMREQAIMRDLFTPRDRESYFAEYLIDALLRGDSEARVQIYRSGLQDGWMTPNEIRSRENLNPMEGGDDLPQPLNRGVAGRQGGDDNDPVPGRNSRPERARRRDGFASNILVGLVKAACERVVRMEIAAATAAEGRHQDDQAWADWCRRFFLAHQAKVMNVLAVDAELAARYCEARRAELVEAKMNGTSLSDLEATGVAYLLALLAEDLSCD